MIVNIPVSVGELVDKLTITTIKLEKISDTAKLQNITREHELLDNEYNELVANIDPHINDLLSQMVKKLLAMNQLIWGIEDDIRDCEARQEFGENFIQLARGVYHSNDQRALIKREINELLGSTLKEEKSYKSY